MISFFIQTFLLKSDILTMQVENETNRTDPTSMHFELNLFFLGQLDVVKDERPFVIYHIFCARHLFTNYHFM